LDSGFISRVASGMVGVLRRSRIEFPWPLLGLAAFFVVLVWFLVGRGEPGSRPTPTVVPAFVLATNTAIPMPTSTVAPTPIPTSTPMEMVRVPAGEFLMGSKDDPDADDDEHPQHTVYVSEFWIDKTEAANSIAAV
jgi:formylglycine-generating enzyme required for sulfatase activity